MKTCAQCKAPIGRYWIEWKMGVFSAELCSDKCCDEYEKKGQGSKLIKTGQVVKGVLQWIKENAEHL